MTKDELVKKVALNAEVTQGDARKYLDAVFQSIAESLVEGEKISINGFGTFEVIARDARKGRNPQTGESIDIPASKAPKFKFSKSIKDAVK